MINYCAHNGCRTTEPCRYANAVGNVEDLIRAAERGEVVSTTVAAIERGDILATVNGPARVIDWYRTGNIVRIEAMRADGSTAHITRGSTSDSVLRYV